MDIIQGLIESKSGLSIVNTNGTFGVAVNTTTATLPTEIVPPSAMPNAISVAGTTTGTIGTTERFIQFPYSGSAATKDYTFTTTENLICDILIVGGGGSGIVGKGGGSSGGVLYYKNLKMAADRYTITIGSGGKTSGTNGTNGNSSKIVNSKSINYGEAVGGIASTTPNGASGIGKNISIINNPFTNSIAKTGGINSFISQTSIITINGQTPIAVGNDYKEYILKHTGLANSQTSYTMTIPSNIIIVCDILMVGGGGAGSGQHGGGGGAGRINLFTSLTLAPGTYTIKVGGGGICPSNAAPGTKGKNTELLLGTTVLCYAEGGGGAGNRDTNSSLNNGGSGGGGDGYMTPLVANGTANSYTATINGINGTSLGNNGGDKSWDGGTAGNGGGGGGAGGAGTTASGGIGGVGGNGGNGVYIINGINLNTNFNLSANRLGVSDGTNIFLAGGGGGGKWGSSTTGGTGGKGGGGAGGIGGNGPTGNNGANAIPDTGSGGGGGSDWHLNKGGTGGSGLFIIKFSNKTTFVNTTGGGGGVGDTGISISSSESIPDGGKPLNIDITGRLIPYAGGGGGFNNNNNGLTPMNGKYGNGGNSSFVSSGNGGNGIIIIRWKPSANNMNNWTQIYENSPGSTAPIEPFNSTLINTTSYKYYALVVKDNWANGTYGCSISEFELFGYEQASGVTLKLEPLLFMRHLQIQVNKHIYLYLIRMEQ